MSDQAEPTPALERPAKRAGTKKTAAKKSTAKKSVAKKATAKKSVAKKTTAKKTAAKKTAATKTAATKTAATKTAAKKAPATKVATTEGSRDRDFDVVLFGATGFTGQLTAAYLARHVPEGCRWALAGRSTNKLEDVRASLAAELPGRADLADLPLVHADSADSSSLDELARRTRVLITTVGPYLTHGRPLVAACAAAGTDYVDLTGEPEFVDRTYLEQHRNAVASGARLVHACGFDSIPHDLGAMFTVQQLPEGQPIRMRGVVRAGGRFSGGTFASAMTAFGRRKEMSRAMKERRAAEGRPADGRRSRARAGKPHHDKVTGFWLLPLPTIDGFVVARSGAALERYGPSFEYAHYAGTKTVRYLAGGVAGVAAMFAAAQVPPLRKALVKRVPAGEGPSEAQRDKAWFTVDFVGEAGGQQVRTRVSGGDPGYGETAKMLSEAALCLAFDDNPVTSGQVTPAVAMGDHLLARLQAAGIRFEVL